MSSAVLKLRQNSLLTTRPIGIASRSNCCPMVVACVTPVAFIWRAVAVPQSASQLFHQSGTIVVAAVPSWSLSLQTSAAACRQCRTYPPARSACTSVGDTVAWLPTDSHVPPAVQPKAA